MDELGLFCWDAAHAGLTHLYCPDGEFEGEPWGQGRPRALRHAPRGRRQVVGDRRVS